MKYVKDTVHSRWYELDKNGNIKRDFPFGYHVVNIINEYNSMKDRETYIKYKKDILSPELCIEYGIDMLDEFQNISSEKLGLFYEQYVNFDSFKTVLKTFTDQISNLGNIKMQKKKNYYLGSIYRTYRFLGSYISRGMLWDESTEKIFIENLSNLIKYCEPCFLEEKEDVIPCEAFEIDNYSDIFILDLWEFLFNQTIPQIKICSECGLLYVNNSGKSLYCHKCNQQKNFNKRRYEQRKKNEERLLHDRIRNNIARAKNQINPNISNYELLNEFTNESNYYWDVVQGKDITINNLYDANIKTKKDYYEWLQTKKQEYKQRKKTGV